jgi:hypothetical protein
LNLTTPSAKDLAFHRDTQDIRKYASSLGSSKHNVVEGAKGYGWRGRLKSSPQYPPELGPLLLSISHVDLVRYSKCKHITPNSSHFETIQVYYCDWKYKYRHDAEKVCASMFSTIRNLEIVEKAMIILKFMATIRFNILVTIKIGIKVSPMLKFNSIRRANNRTSAEKTIKI